MGLWDSILHEFSMKPEWVGKRFEEYIIHLFDERYFSIVEQTHSWKTNQDRYVESSMNPDYVMRYLPTKEEFAIECKYRSNLDKGMLNWSNPNQLRRYQEFAKKRNIPVYLAIGLGGFDDEPKD